jgi:hypothetical protein
MNNRPVFVVGSARSGTTLLYHMLLSAGNFAVFRAETHAYDVLGPRFGHFRTPAVRRRFLNHWLGSRHFELSGLNANEFSTQIMSDCHSTGDFLRIFMGGIARLQKVGRWSDCTPAHISHIRAIKREIPDALILHVIRDGRDVALSAARLNWTKPLPADRSSPRMLAALSWHWAVQGGRKAGRKLGEDYCEVRFEQLVQSPQETLDGLSGFVGQPLDYNRIKEAGIGSVSEPNTSFRSTDKKFEPVGRFKTGMDKAELGEIEFVLGDLLDDLGYERVMNGATADSPALLVKRRLYESYFSGKLWARVNTPLGRRTSLQSLQIW